MDRDYEIARFDRALSDPSAAQDVARRDILADNVATEYGRANGFAAAEDYAAFAARVPVSSYDDVEPYMLRMVEGARGILIAADALYFGVSSGTTGGKKYVPIHAGFGAETELWGALE